MTLPSNLKNNSQWVLVGPMGPLVSENLQNFPLIGVDGGADFTKRMDLWVGDADSYHGSIQPELVMRYPQDKDQSDLSLALSLFKEKNSYTFHMWGFLGGRGDHELFNLGESLLFLEHHELSTMLFYGQDGKVYYELKSCGHWKFNHHGLFSLGVLKKTNLLLTGDCRYNLSNEESLLPLSSLGLSNKGFGLINLQTPHPLFLYYPEGK